MKTKRKSTKVISGLAICLCTLCTANCEAQFKKPVVRTITSGNNVFEVHDYADTVEMLDTKTMDVHLVIKNPNPLPVKINHLDIYAKEDVQNPPSINEAILKNLLIKTLYKEIGRFTNGRYRMLISNVIIDDKGKIVYYNFDGFEKDANRNNNWKPVYKTKTAQWQHLIKQTLDKTPACKPASVYGSAVPYRLSDEVIQQAFFINNGMIQ